MGNEYLQNAYADISKYSNVLICICKLYYAHSCQLDHDKMIYMGGGGVANISKPSDKIQT